MSLMKIEVVPDASTPSGGHAIIRLRGIGLLPQGTTFRIDPIDEVAGGPQPGWPSGDLKPLETRQIADGVEFRVGPDVVDAPRLEPGTPVTISVPGSQISGELVWPDLPVSSGGTMAAVVMTPSQMANEIAAAERARLEAASRPPVPPAPIPKSIPAMPPKIETAAIARPEVNAPPVRELAAAAAPPVVADVPPNDAPANRGLPGLPPLYTQDTQSPGERARPNDKSLSRLAKQSDKADPVAMESPDAGLPAILLKRSAADGGGSIGVSRGELRPGTIDGRISAQPLPSRMLPFLAGAAATALAAAAIIAVIFVRQTQAPLGLPGTVGAGATVAAAGKAGLADVFTAGYQSPRGEIATDVDLPTALRLADYNLHGIDRPVDRAEAEFWLKKAMSLTAGHSQLRWAMTQLGTLQAEPVAGTPDYEKARMLWEIAAANGDPVAMCFLGTLAEFGLGAAADRSKALEHFKRSKEFGGCPNADDAIARLSK